MSGDPDFGRVISPPGPFLTDPSISGIGIQAWLEKTFDFSLLVPSGESFDVELASETGLSEIPNEVLIALRHARSDVIRWALEKTKLSALGGSHPHLTTALLRGKWTRK